MKKLLIYLFCSIPLLLISGPFLSGVAASFLSIFGFMKIKSWGQIKKNPLLKYFLILFIIFCFYLIFSSYISSSPNESLKSSLLYFRFIFYTLGIYFLISEFKDKIHLYLTLILIFSFILVSTSIAIELIIQYLNLSVVLESQYTGIFLEEKIAGSYVARFYPLVVGLLYLIGERYFKDYNKKLVFVLFLVSLFVIFMSGERSALALFIFSNFLMIIGLKTYRQNLVNAKTIFCSVFLVAFFSMISPQVFERIVFKTAEQLTHDDGSIKIFSDHHGSHINTSIKMFNQNKLTGVGPRMFRHLCHKSNYLDIFYKEIQYSNTGEPKRIEGRLFELVYSGCSTHPHNLLFQIAAETGVIGLFFYIWFIAYIYFQLFKILYLNKGSSNVILFSSLVCLCSSFFPFIPSHNFFGSYINIFYFLFLSFYLYEANEIS